MKKILTFVLALALATPVVAGTLQDHQPSVDQQLDFALGYVGVDLGNEIARGLGAAPLQRRLFSLGFSLLCSVAVNASRSEHFTADRMVPALIGTGCSLTINF